MLASPSDSYAALRVRPVRHFLLGRFCATLGHQMLGVAIGWQVYERTSSAFALGIVGLVQVIPVVLFALPAGHLADRKHRRDVAVIANLLLAVTGAGLALVAHAGAPLALLYALLFCRGIIVSLEAPASSSLLPQLMGPELFANANAWRSAGWQLAATGGPALAGLILTFDRRATSVYLLEVLGALFFALALASLPRPPIPPPAPAGPPADELRAGLRFVFATPLLLSAITLDLFAVLFGGATALLPIFARDLLHVGPAGLGWLRAAPSFGALAMSFLTTRRGPFRQAGRALLVAVAGFGLATIGFALSRHFALSLACLFLTGVCDNVSVVIRATLEQLITPDRLRGRVSAINYVFIGLSNEMGEFESGLTAALLGPVGSVLLGGVGTLLVVLLVAWRWPVLGRLGHLADVRPAPDL